MALYNGFFNSNPSQGLTRKYDAEDISRLFDGLIGDGVLETVGEKLMVKSNNGMTISVGTGRAWFNHCWVRNDSKMDLVVPDSDPLLGRIDTVVLEINRNLDVLNCFIKIITGAPAAVPVAATLEDTVYIKQVPLAYINVAADMQEVTTTDITNCVGTSKCPFVIGIASFMTIDDFVEKWGIEWTNWINAKETQYDTMFHTKSDQIDAWLLSREAGWTEFLSTKTTEWNAWLAEKNTILDGLKASVTALNSAFVTGKECTNINEEMESGYYAVSSTTEGTKPNNFSGSGVLHVMNGAGTVTQILYDNATDHILFKRVSTDGETWSAWKESGSEGGGGGGTAGGSIIKVTTTENSLIGKNVTIGNNTESASASFNSDKVAVIEGFIGVGECRLTTTDGTYTGEKTINIPYFGNFTESIALWKATVNVTVQDATTGHEVKVKNSAGALLATITTDATGVAEYIANAPGTYTFESLVGGVTVSKDVIITDAVTYTVELNTFKIYGFHFDGSVTDSNPSTHVSYDVTYEGKDVLNKNYSSIRPYFSGDPYVMGLNDWKNAFFMPKLILDTGQTLSSEGIRFKNNDGGKPCLETSDELYDLSPDQGRILFVKFPKIWIKVVPDNGETTDTSATVYIADAQVDPDFHAWAFYDDNNVEHDSILIGSTSTSYRNDKVEGVLGHHTTGADGGLATLAAALGNIKQRNNAYMTYSVENGVIASMLTILTMLITKTANIQSVMGMGNCGAECNREGIGIITQNINKGYSGVQKLFIAPVPVTSGTPVLFGIEHLWGDRSCYLNKAVHSSVSENHKQYCTFTYQLPDGTEATVKGNDDNQWTSGSIVDGCGWHASGVVIPANIRRGDATTSGIIGDVVHTSYTTGILSIGGRAGNNTGWGEKCGLFAMDCQATSVDDYNVSWWGRYRVVGWLKEDAHE